MASKPNNNKALAKACSVKVIKDIIGPKFLVKSSPIFGEHRQLCTSPEPHPTQPMLSERSKIAETSRKDMKTDNSKLRISQAHHHAVRLQSDNFYHYGDLIRVWREKLVAHRVSGWFGPFEGSGIDFENELVFGYDFILISARSASISQVEPHLIPEKISLKIVTKLRNGFFNMSHLVMT